MKDSTMTITLELPPEVQASLRAKIAGRDAKSVRQLLADAMAPIVEILLQPPPNQLNDDEFEATADLLADELTASCKSNTPVLSDYAVSRAGIYEDHP